MLASELDGQPWCLRRARWNVAKADVLVEAARPRIRRIQRQVQTANAAFLAGRGAAVLLPQRELSPERLAELVRSMDRAALLEMARRARALGKPEAARTVAARCMELAR